MKNINYKVIKRSGEVVSFEVSKIRKIIAWAIQGFESSITAEQLEASLEMDFKPKMKSKEITDSIIEAAKKLTSIDQPEWRIVAARLKISSMYKDANESRDYNTFGYDNYLRFLKQAEERGLYTDEVRKSYSKEELKKAGKEMNPKYDMDFDFAGANLFDVRYSIKYKNKIFELPQEMFMTIALLIERFQEKSVRMERVFDTYHKLASRKISLATPILINLRKPKGNLSSCFITAVGDSLPSIQYVEEQAGFISQAGGGVGINISRPRSKNAPIQGHKNASGGIIPWIRSLNDKAVAVNQLGKRKGAFTVSLDVWHPDTPNFLELQTENGDPRQKAMDIQPQVVIHDEFMRRVEKRQYWYFVDPYEVGKKYNQDIAQLHGKEFEKLYNKIIKDMEEAFKKERISQRDAYGSAFDEKMEALLEKNPDADCLHLIKKVKAIDLMIEIMQVAMETGRPYISFKDTMNKYNPNKDSGTILAGNLCMESFSNTSPSEVGPIEYKDGLLQRNVIPGDLHTCNLLSVVLSNIEDTPEEFESVCSTGVRILDNLIDFTTAPVGESTLHNLKYRTIGVGFMGYADYIAKKKVQYEESSKLADELFEELAYYCTKASMELAKERGSFESFEKSEYKKGIILGKNKTWFRKNSKHHKKWTDLIDDILKYGLRNSQITAIAPNSSTSLFMGCTASILPIFGKFFMDNGKTTVPIMPPFIKECFWFYKENKLIDQRKLVDVVSHMQKWIDTGISMEIILNPNLKDGEGNQIVNAKYFYQVIMDAWKKECKTIYYIRSVQKDGELGEKDECVSCAG